MRGESSPILATLSRQYSRRPVFIVLLLLLLLLLLLGWFCSVRKHNTVSFSPNPLHSFSRSFSFCASCSLRPKIILARIIRTHTRILRYMRTRHRSCHIHARRWHSQFTVTPHVVPTEWNDREWRVKFWAVDLREGRRVQRSSS